MRKTIPILLLGLLPVAGCLIGDRSHVLHLEADGSVTWIAHERAVRSDAGAAADRDREEAEYLSEARAEQQAVARGLAKLGPMSLRATLLRDERPFQAMTEARFAALEPLLQRLLDGAGVEGSAKVARTGEETHLTITLKLEADGPEAEGDEDLAGLLGDFEHMQFALAHGRFVAATGFAISEDGALATPLGIDDEVAGGARLLLSLAWTDDAVMPAKAGIHRRPGSQDELRGNRWTPAFAGVTGSCPDLSELSGLVSPVLDRIVGRT